MPVTIKVNVDQEGYATTNGLKAQRDLIARADNPVVANLRKAGAVLLGNQEAGKKHGLKPRARIRAFANIGSEPAMMLTGPVDVTEKLFARTGMKASDIDLFELN